MKITEFRKLIREEARKVLKEEDNLDSAPNKIAIKDAAGRSVVATITQTSAGTEIESGGQKYFYAGKEPFDAAFSLFYSRAIRVVKGKYREMEDGAIAKILKAAPRFKRVKI